MVAGVAGEVVISLVAVGQLSLAAEEVVEVAMAEEAGVACHM
jgi:hypothetical protein